MYIANGYGPSAAYSSAGYSFKSREHLSKNAGTLAAEQSVRSRVAWLKQNPDDASRLLADNIARRNEKDATERSQALRDAVGARQVAAAKRKAPRPIEAPLCPIDDTSLLSLLNFCQSEAKAIYERAKFEHADTYIIKSSLAAHRDFSVTLQKCRDEARDDVSTPHDGGAVPALNLYQRICKTFGQGVPELRGPEEPTFMSATETEHTHDEEELRWSLAETLHQYDTLTEASTRPEMKTQLTLLEVLNKTVTKLVQLQAQRRQNEKDRPAIQAQFEIDPNLILRWTKVCMPTDDNEIA